MGDATTLPDRKGPGRCRSGLFLDRSGGAGCVADLARRLENTRITAFGPDLGVANTEYVRLKSGKRGRQTQVWAHLPDGWRVVSAHVSLLD
ncbi:DUF3225 domain-containing protein [Oleomonas cavernae]|uniref:DUF3225 domain-containing protein n=1 Tax=Oleomonas cavernae TaxID=2320859 RepID=A0A418WEH1_9PROT|nr:DUF3225 domain-containing protein [Oleomonas cavernae]